MAKSSIKKVKEVIQEFPLSSWAVNKRTTVLVLTVLIAILGIWSYRTVPKESFPEITQPEIYIGTPYPGNSPVDMENLVSRPIEKEVYNIKGLKELKSTNIQDHSTIIATFEPTANVEEVLQDVKDAVDKVKKDLPTDLPADPDIFELDFSDFPVVNVNVFGKVDPNAKKNFEILRKCAEYLQDEFEKLGEISEAEIRGLQEQEVKIQVDPFAMEARLVSFGDIAGAIGNENMTTSGGDILIDGVRRNIRMVGEYKNMDEIRNTIVKSEDGNIVYLHEIASVDFDYIERTSYARMDQQQVLTLDVKKRSGENLIVGVSKVKEAIKQARKDGMIPDGVEIVLTGDQSVQTKEIVDNLENSIISGVLLVVLVLLFFLGLRNAMFVGIAIPLSMLMGFVILNFMGITMNMVVLFSLILALGMLVDNGIVVVENIYRLHENGMPLKQAAKEGVGEVALPIIASTATTLAAFFPLLFWNSLMGEFMKYLPLTLIIVLSSSLFVGLVINPVLTSIWMRIDSGDKALNRKRILMGAGIWLAVGILFLLMKTNTLASLCILIALIIVVNQFGLRPMSHWFRSNALPRLENFYEKLITRSLKGLMPLFIFGGVIVLMMLSQGFYNSTNPQTVFFPEGDPLYVNIFIETPIGTDIEETNRLTEELEEIVTEVCAPDSHAIEAILAQVGEGTADPTQGVSMGVSPNKARITVSFVKFTERKGANTRKIQTRISEAMDTVSRASIVVDRNNDGPPTGKPINVEITGKLLEPLIAEAENVKRRMESAGVPGVEKLQLDIELGKPELKVKIDREAVRRFGMSSGQVMDEIRTALFGKELGKYKLGEDDYKIQLRLKDEARYDLERLMNKKITYMNQKGRFLQIPIRSVASVNYTSTYGSVKRKNLEKVVTISSNVKPNYNAQSVVEALQQDLEGYKLPTGMGLKWTGEQQEQEEEMGFMMFAFMGAVFLIFIILVSQFNSVVLPVVILVTVVFSTIGVFLGLAFTKMDFVVMMMGIGIISLAGVVVNNAIVLIDYINLIRKRRRAALGIDEDGELPFSEVKLAIIEGGKIRLRPVLLTAITTVFGLIPLAVGFNINFFTLLSEFDANIYVGGDTAAIWSPLAWTVIYGLVFATFLTLVVVPVMYLGVYRLKAFLVKKFSSQ